jgi:LemA protein
MRLVGLVLMILVVVIVSFFGCSFSTRNDLIQKDEGANQAWANVETAYQRRLDLIPNLVETVKGATKYEGETLAKITENRNQILGLAKEFGQALKSRDTGKMDSLESALMSSVRAYTGLAAEAYPGLKAMDQFTTLMHELEGTENRVAVARRDFNAAVASLNTSVRQWGWMPFCGGVKTRESFTADPGAKEAPKVNFK